MKITIQITLYKGSAKIHKNYVRCIKIVDNTNGAPYTGLPAGDYMYPFRDEYGQPEVRIPIRKSHNKEGTELKVTGCVANCRGQFNERVELMRNDGYDIQFVGCEDKEATV